MDDKQRAKVLERATKRAIGNGWMQHPVLHHCSEPSIEETEYGYDVLCRQLGGGTARHGLGSVNDIVFNHDFARALWGEEHDCGAGYHKKRELMRVPNLRGGGYTEHEINLDYVTYCLHNTTNWQYHLQQMVIAEDPIAYLSEHLDGQ